MEFERFKEYLFRLASEQGFGHCELYYVSGSGILLTIPAGEQYNLKSGVAFRGSMDGGTGSAYAEDLSEEAARFLLDSTRENIRTAGGLVESFYDGNGDYLPLDNADKDLEDVGKVKKLHEQIVREIEACGNLSKTTGVVHAVSSTLRIVNTAGLDVIHRSNYIYSILYMVATHGGVLKNSLLYRGGTSLSDVNPEELVRSGFKKVNGYFGAEQVASGTYNVIFPSDTASLMVQGIAPFFSAAAVLNSLSLLGGKLGEQVASDKVTIVDDPLDVRGVFAWPFDAEGVPAVKRTLVDRGILQDYLHSRQTATEFGEALPGSQWRLDYNYPPGVYPSNFYVAPGTQSFEDLLQEMGDGLYVTDVTAYFHGAGINAVSGEYSIPATGYVVRNGKLAEPFDGITIAGNLYDFMRNISAVGDDLLFGLPTSFRPGAPMTFGCYGSPSLLVQGIAVSGK